MKPTITGKLANLCDRLEELNLLLSSEAATSDMDTYRKLTREHAEIEPVVGLYQAYKLCEQDIQTAQDMANDPEMREFAELEIKEGHAKLEDIE